MDLSEKRAKSIVDFLIKEGIQADRCISEGMGESALAIKCVCEQCTEDQHQANRRSTFTLIR
ncbi:MAG: OmpA family protein [Saprospiraceae bacterium]|nr:OmpA family protein [Saprospiraceae bacterium]